MKTIKLFSILKSKKGGLYGKPALGKFGVKSISVELNDGKVIDLKEDSVLFLNDPRESVKSLLEQGKLTEAQAEERLSKLEFLSKEVVLKV